MPTTNSYTRYEESLVAYDEAIALDPLRTLLYIEKADVLLHLQRLSEGLATYEQLIRLEPNEAEHYQLKGDLLVQLGRDAEALEAYRQSTHLDPSTVRYFDKEGNSCLPFKDMRKRLLPTNRLFS